MAPLDSGRQAWEDWAQVDPLWAIRTEHERSHGRWDLDEFFGSGRDTIESVLRQCSELGRPTSFNVALDFGCGVGRLTRPLADHFTKVYGLDIAPGMIDQANEYQRGNPVCEFVVQDADDLRRFADGSIDFVCCLLVLQHIPSRVAIETYLREFVRVLRPGGIAVVQLPTFVPAPAAPTTLRARLALRTRLTTVLRSIGVAPKFLYERLGWAPAMPMTAIPRDDTCAVLDSAGGSVVVVTELTDDDGGVESSVYFVVKSDVTDAGSAPGAPTD
jgi:SAM-dependent methyltransferase